MNFRSAISRSLGLLIFSAVLCASAVAQKTQNTEVSTEKEIQEDVAAAPCNNNERFEKVKSLFRSKGAPIGDIKTEDFGHVKNLLVTKSGKTDEIIVVGAHYDKTRRGCGAIDNWSGIVVIANLYKTIRNITTEKTIKFAAFGKEENGLVGSKAMAGAIPKSNRERYCAMVNFDSFGLAYPQIMRDISDQKLIDLAEKTAKNMDFPFRTKPVKEGSSDSASFQAKNIPALGIHGLNDTWRHYLHTPLDQVKNVNNASVYSAYLLSISLLKAIDAEDCGAFRERALF
ncbi:MAG: M20/M25/M40 family metallo-hydrolase [Pyrinomonadaceae bacterium]